MVGRQQRCFGLDEPDDAPRALPGFRRPVEVGARDGEDAFGAGAEERAGRFEPGLDADEAEPERTGRGARLAALVRDVDRERVAVGQTRSRPVLFFVRAGREFDVEHAVGVDLRPAAGDGLTAAAAGIPPPPARIDGLALDLPDGLAPGDGKSEVIPGFAFERRGPVQAQRFFRVLDRNLERRPLVLLDAHPGIAVRRGAQAPPPERPAGRRDDELAAGRAEGVRRHGGLGDALAVDVLEPDGDGRPGLRAELAEVRPALIGQDLPEDLLSGAVDRPVGVDQGGPGIPGFGASLKIEVVGVEGDVPAFFRQKEMGA